MTPSKNGAQAPAHPTTHTIPFTEYDLDNGLHVILAPAGNVPVVMTNLWYHIGSKDEDPARTGFAHLFEHMMFQGSRNVAKTEHFKYIQQAGGVLNATTSVDRTNYFQTVPSSELELALWLESDRMLALDVTEENFQNQRDVVKEEWRQRYKNRPYGLVWETLIKQVFPTSGYHWTTIGSMEHLDASTIEEVRAFHSKYYLPNNCSLTVCGAFNERDARRMIDRYFAAIPSGNAILRPEQSIAPIEHSERITMHDNVHLAGVYLAWRGPAIFSRDDYVMDLVCNVLDSGRSSRFYQELIYRREIAREAEAFNHALELSGTVVISAKVQLRSTPEEVEAALLAEVQKLTEQPVSEQELEKVKNRLEMSLLSGRSELGKRADSLQRGFMFTGQTGKVNTELEIIRSVTAQELQETARRYFSAQPFVTLHVLPK